MPPKNNSIQARETLYNNLTEDGYGLGSLSDFESAIKDSKARITLYDNLVQDGYELGDYDSFMGSLGYGAPENTVFTKVADKVKEIGSTIGINMSGLGSKIAEAPKKIAQAYKEVGMPQTEEQAFEFAYHPSISKLAEQTEQDFLNSDEYKRFSKEIAAAPESKKQALIDQLQAAYMNSPSVESYGKEVEQMALQYEAARDPILKVQLLSEEIRKRQEQLEEIKPVADFTPNTELGKLVEEYDKNKTPESYNKLTAALRQKLTPEEVQKQKAWKAEEKRLKDEISELNNQLSEPLATIADKGLKQLDEYGIRNLEQQVYTYRQNAANDREYARYSQQHGGNDVYYEQTKRLRGLQTAEKLLKNLKSIANASTESGFKSLWQGINNNDWQDLLSLGITGISENINLAEIMERMNKGEEVIPDERYAVEVYGLYQNLSSQKELPVTYVIGQSFIQSLPFMLEIATTGGLRSAVSKSVSGAASKGLAKSLPKLSPKVLNAVGKGAGYTVGTMAAVPVSPMTYKAATERQLGSYHVDTEGNVEKSERAESIPESLGWAGLSTFITLAAEDGTGVFAQGMKYTGRGVGKILGLTKKVKANSQVGSYMKSLQKHARWNGFLEEIGEEYDEALLMNLLVPATAVEQDNMEQKGTSRWDDFFDPKKALEIAGSIGLTQLLMSAPSKVNRYHQSGKARADLKKTQSKLPESISRKMVEVMNLPDFEQQQTAIETIDFSELQDDEVLAVQKYILSKYRYDILKGRAEGMEQADRVEQLSSLIGSVSNGLEKVTIGTNAQGRQYFVLSDNGSDGVIVMDGEGNKRMIPRSDLVAQQEYSAKELQAAYEQQTIAEVEQEHEVKDQQEVEEEIAETPTIEEEERPTTQQHSFGDKVTVDGASYTLGNELENGSWIAQDEKGTDVVLSAEQLESGNNSVPEKVEKSKRTLKVDDKETLDIIQQEDGVAEIDRVFTSEKQAQSTVNKLNERYPNSTFEVVNNTDADDAYAEAAYRIRATPKTMRQEYQSAEAEEEHQERIKKYANTLSEYLGYKPVSSDSEVKKEVEQNAAKEGYINQTKENAIPLATPTDRAIDEAAKKEENSSSKTNNNTNFEEQTKNGIETADNVGLTESQTTNEDDNGRNDTAISDTIRQDTAEVDAGESAEHTTRNDAGEQPGRLSDERGEESIRPRASTDDTGNESGGSGGNSNISDSDTDRHVGSGLQTRRTRGADRGRDRRDTESSSSSDLLNQNNYVIEDANSIVPKGEIAKIKANIRAIKLLKSLEQELSDATPEEKKILAQYAGWGGLSEVLNTSRKWDGNWTAKYKAYHDQLVELLTPEEFTAAINSTINAHYTSGTIVTEMWRIVERLGFSGGTVLEPASGTGNFFGLMPKHLAEKSALKAYELDSITGRIMAKLYPDAHVRVTGYENSTDNGIDLVVTNVPFGQIAPYDKHNKDLSSFSLHNYFIAKSIRQLAPNGIGIYITSSSTMDSGSSAKFRQWVTHEGNADFMGAIRLPNNAFAENAGTSVTTDILIFRKRDSENPSPFARQFRYAVPFKETTDKEGNPYTLDINEYFVINPSMMLGEMMLAHEAKAGGLYSANDATLVPLKGQNLQEALSEAIAQLPENISDINNVPQSTTIETDVKEGALVEQQGKIYEVENGVLVVSDWVGKTLNNQRKKKVSYEQVAKDYLKIKAIANSLLDAEREDRENIEELRAGLNKAYDAFVNEYGRLNNNLRLRFLLDSDLDYNTVFALEDVKKHTTIDAKGNPKHSFTIEKADIFSKRVVFPVKEPTTAENLTDAIEISIAYRGNVAIEYIADLISSTPEEVETEMLTTGLGYINPETGLLEDKDTYLSGYVRTKYHQAVAAAESNPAYQANVQALKEVIPADIPATQIKFKLGSTFINNKYIEAFVLEKFKVSARIQYNKLLGMWIVDVRGGSYSAENTTTFGTKRITAMALLEKGLNQRQPEIYDTFQEDGKKKRVKNADDTGEAQNALTIIANEFENYLAENEEGMAQIESTYNEQYNDYVEKVFSEPSIKHYPNASRGITLRIHQKVAVSRGLKSSLLLAHQVGTGKTFTMQTIAMEKRRLGIAKKPMLVVQNATLEQFALSFKKLYPSVKLLAPTKKMMDAKNRQRLFSLIAYGDYDAIVIPQSFVDMIPDDEERVKAYIKEQIDELQRVLDVLEGEENDSLKKELESALNKLEEELSGGEKKKRGGKVKDQAKRQLGVTKRIQRQADRRTDNVLTFEQMGVDALLVDEAHAYKKLGFFTKLSRIKGIDTGRSKRAFGMYLKTQLIQERSGGNNVIFATGTPITNTMAEVWTMMKFISGDILEKYSISSFDEFASMFGSIEPSLEFTTAGSFKIVQRFKSYLNAPELLKAFRAKTHVVLTEDIPEFKEGNTIPKLKDNDFTKLIIPQSDGLTSVMEEIKQELTAWENLSPKEKKEKRHVPLVLFNKAKQAAIDLRLLNPHLEDDAGSKTSRVVKEVKRIYDATTKYRGAQLIFSDMFQSPEKMGIPRFNLYQAIKQKLINHGIPEKEIAIIHDYEGEKREHLFEQLNKGEVRILLGSTERMGVGVNVQERLAALHHVDAPPRPMDFEQRNGRIIRQGNLFALLGQPVEVVTYGVEKTLDATAYQRLAIKQKFINQMMKGENLDREVGDDAEEDSPSDMTFDQMMSTLSGSKHAILHVQKSFELKKLETAERNHKRRQVEINKSIRRDEEYVESAKEDLQHINNALKQIAKHFADGKVKEITINRKTHSENLSSAIDEALKSYLREVQKTKLAEKEPLKIHLNSYSTPLEIVLFNLLNNEYTYTMRVEGYKLEGNNIFRSDQGLLSSLRARFVNLEGVASELAHHYKEVEARIPVLKTELKKPFDKQDKLNQLIREVNELEELMQQETETNTKKENPKSVEQYDNKQEEADEIAEPFAPLAGTETKANTTELTNEDYIAEISEPAFATSEAEPTGNNDPNVADSGSELITPIESIEHSKTNAELFLAKLTKEVEKEVYYTISTIAKKHGKGYWSKYAKGFLFKTEADANNFRNEVNGSSNLVATPVELGFNLKGAAEVLGLTKGTRPLDVRGGAILKRFTDREIYLKVLQQKIKELGGKVNSSSDVYNDMTLSIGRSTHSIQQFEKKQLTQLTDTAHKVVEKAGSSWSWSNDKPHNGEPMTGYDALEMYLRAKDIVEAEQLNLKDRGRFGFESALGISPDVFIAQYEHKLGGTLRKELWDKVRAATSYSLSQLTEAGMITADEYNEYTLRKFYIPQRGWKNRDLDETIYSYLHHTGGQFYDTGYNPVTIQAKGRTSLSSNPLPYIQSMAHTAAIISERNKYKNKALKLVLDNIDIGRKHGLFNLRRTWYVSVKDADGNPVKDASGNVLWEEVYLQPDKSLFEEDARTRRQIAQLRAELLDAVNDNDVDLAEKISNDIEYLSERINVAQSINSAYKIFKTQSEHNQNEVMVWLDGQQYVMIFNDERVANAINKADFESVSGYLQNWFGRGTRWLASVNTSKNPSFAIFNFLRDYGFANLTHLMDNGLVYGGKFNINVFNPKLHAAIFREVTGSKNRNTKFDDLLQQFFEDGAATGYSFLKDLDQLKRNVEKEFTRNKKGNPVRWTKGKVKALSDAFGAITEYSELITRFATYVTSLDMGRTRHQAAVDAKNVTVNFNRKGTMSPMLNMFYMFFNATIQGGMRAADVAIRHKGKLAAAAASLYLLGFLNTLFTMPDGDDDENRKFSEFDRKQNAIVGGIKIPLPHFFRAFWGAGAHTALAFKGEKEVKEATFDSFKDLGNEFVLEQFNMLSYFKYNHKSRAIELNGEAVVDLLPSMVKPFGELVLNKDFVGRTIYKAPYVNADKIPKAFWSKPDIGNVWQELSYLMLEAGGGDREIRKLYNTETGRYISGWFNVNPEALEHLFTAYTGGVGRFFNDSYKTLENAAKGKFETTTVPVLNRFVKQYDEDKAFLRDYYMLTDRIRDIEFARDATKKAIIRKNGERYDKAFDEYKQLLSSKQYVTAMKAKVHLKATMDRIKKILEKLDEEKDQDVVLELKAERTRLMKKAKGYLEAIA